MPDIELDPEVQRVQYEVRRFRQHFVTYVAVVGVLFFVNVLTGGFWFGHWWFFWIALIWGVILALEGAHLFGQDIGKEWEDRMVDQVLARRRRQGAGASSDQYTPPPPPSPPSDPSVYGATAPSSNSPTTGTIVATPNPTIASQQPPIDGPASAESAPPTPPVV